MTEQTVKAVVVGANIWTPSGKKMRGETVNIPEGLAQSILKADEEAGRVARIVIVQEAAPAFREPIEQPPVAEQAEAPKPKRRGRPPKVKHDEAAE